MITTKFQLEPLTCPSCIKKIEAKLGNMEGVNEVKVLFNSSKVKATYNEEDTSKEKLQEMIVKLGYSVIG
ncbi:Copper chaperone CopZ [Gracilibacillus ureilyticus]|uniref:Copper chaperone CopZ n=1 Tax=Gracilibacillus ureilyticus TaxID=531814 RepID=A0A1H9LGM1_9BACI|nr:heavy metal-associated domain-containing protein [Gracilibacillus ureilyticus]SER10508.1 Copper chaperone CopZ [Gracilibacillus ureilyticus]